MAVPKAVLTVSPSVASKGSRMVAKMVDMKVDQLAATMAAPTVEEMESPSAASMAMAKVAWMVV